MALRKTLVALAAALFVPLVATSVAAQVHWEPVPSPELTAEGTRWFDKGQPILYAGDLYYPSGPRVFFDGYRMVPAGEYDGIPLYADTTLEPYSVVFVPAGRKLMQPYERLRAGVLAGTTGSMAPWFPVQTPGSSSPTFEDAERRAWHPRGSAHAFGEPGQFPPPYERAAPGDAPRAHAAPGAPGEVPSQFAGQVEFEGQVESVRRAERTLGIWVSWNGYRWRSAGEAIPLASSGLTVIGEYHGFPVFGRAGDKRVIYLPGGEGIVAPFERFEDTGTRRSP